MSNEGEHRSKHQVNSPCVRNCCLDDKDICLGCFRSITEIVGWSASNDTERKEILARCQQRKEEQQRHR